MSQVLDNPEWLGLVAAIRFEPLDDTARLVAADWLEEKGQDDNVPALAGWAQFIRAQVAMTSELRNHGFTDSCDCRVCQSERRATMLFDRWGIFWWHYSIRRTTPL